MTRNLHDRAIGWLIALTLGALIWALLIVGTASLARAGERDHYPPQPTPTPTVPCEDETPTPTPTPTTPEPTPTPSETVTPTPTPTPTDVPSPTPTVVVVPPPAPPAAPPVIPAVHQAPAAPQLAATGSSPQGWLLAAVLVLVGSGSTWLARRRRA